jgi:hypothetical protein
MAGNIIHAIATTNAIVGGIIVSEALKVLAGDEPQVYLQYNAMQLCTVQYTVRTVKYSLVKSLTGI